MKEKENKPGFCYKRTKYVIYENIFFTNLLELISFNR